MPAAPQFTWAGYGPTGISEEEKDHVITLFGPKMELFSNLQFGIYLNKQQNKKVKYSIIYRIEIKQNLYIFYAESLLLLTLGWGRLCLGSPSRCCFRSHTWACIIV